MSRPQISLQIVPCELRLQASHSTESFNELQRTILHCHNCTFVCIRGMPAGIRITCLEWLSSLLRD
jgi:hypothetical protein